LVVDPEALRSRLRRLDRCLQVLRAIAGTPLPRFVADEALRDRAERNLQVAIQSCLDVSSHLVSGLGWGDPGSYEEAIVLAGRKLGLDEAFLAEFRKIAGLRNVLVHDYLPVDPARVHAALGSLEDSRTFAKDVVSRFPEAGT
jgi:uncharacterized protein YutE (UPF0331/DUF86 family)